MLGQGFFNPNIQTVSGGGDGGPVTWASIIGRPSAFVSTIPLVEGLESELSDIRTAILEGGGSGTAGDFLPLTGGIMQGNIVMGENDLMLSNNFGFRAANARMFAGFNGNVMIFQALGTEPQGNNPRSIVFRPNMSDTTNTNLETVLRQDGTWRSLRFQEGDDFLENKYATKAELNAVRCTCDGHNGGSGEGGNCNCPSFPILPNQINWQGGSVPMGGMSFAVGNHGIHFNPNQQGASIESRSNGNMFIIRANAVDDSLNRGIVLRPNLENSPQPGIDATLFANGQFDAGILSENGQLLEDKYMPFKGNHIPENSINSTDPPTVYPMGPSQYTVNSNLLNFPFPNLSVRTYRFANGRIEQYAVNLSGTQRWFRNGEGEFWVSGGWHPMPSQSSINAVAEQLGGHSIVTMPESDFDPDTADSATLFFLYEGDGAIEL